MITPQNLQPVAHGSPAAAPQSPQADIQSEGTGAAFKALLERLEKSANDLDVASDAINDPRQLGEAVETARASVEEALLAGSGLLEAYRAAQAQGGPDAAPTEPNETN